jgi:hypothetical protein
VRRKLRGIESAIKRLEQALENKWPGMSEQWEQLEGYDLYVGPGGTVLDSEKLETRLASKPVPKNGLNAEIISHIPERS